MKPLIFLPALFLLLSGCELCYNPVETDDVPPSPGTVWERNALVVKESVQNPFTDLDLSQEMSLSCLLDIALYNNPSTRASWNAARAAAYGYHVSLSPYYPTINYAATWSVQTSKGANLVSSNQGVTSTTSLERRSSTTITNNLSLNYLVLDFGGRSAAAELALQTLFASDWQHNFTMQQVMISVLNAYTAYLGNRALVHAYEQDLHDAKVALEAATVMRGAGLATLTDVLSAQANLEQIRTSLAQAQGAESTSFGELLIAVGLPPDACVSVEDLPQALPVIEISGDICSLLELAKERRPDLGVALAAVKQQEAQLAISYSNGMPTITANASWNQTSFISPRIRPGYNETAFLQLNVPVFQGFYFLNQQRQLRAQIEQALANLDVQVAAVEAQVVTNYYALTSAAAALPSSEAAVEYSQRAFRGFVVQYKTGTASILDVLTALTTLSNARSQQVVTRTQWASALANLAFSVGTLEECSGHWQQSPPPHLYQLPIRDDDHG